jgi:hypothetical protein
MEKLNKEKKTITIASVKILKQGVKEGVDYEGNPTRRE